MTSWDLRVRDGFKDKDDANPAEVREPDVDGGDTQMNEEATGSGQITDKKHKTSAPVPPNDLNIGHEDLSSRSFIPLPRFMRSPDLNFVSFSSE
jgi:hypothetical protein